MGSFLAGLFILLSLFALLVYAPYVLIRGLINPAKYSKHNDRKRFVKNTLAAWCGGVVLFVVIGMMIIPDTSENPTQTTVEAPKVVTPVTTPEPTTASVATQAKAQPNPIKDYGGIVVPYSQKNMPKLYANWGGEWVKKINAMMPKVVAKVANNPKCDTPEIVELSDNRSRVKKEAVFFVDCKNGERFYVSQNELVQDQPLKPESEQLKGEPHMYIQACRESVKNHLQFPSSFDDEILSTTARKTPSGNIEVVMPFTAKNALGIEIPQTARCLITTKKQIEISFSNR